MLSRVPDDKLDWQPHVKSMSMRALATHIAELPGWITMVLNTDELDFAAGDYKPTKVDSTVQLLEVFESNYSEGRANLEKTNETELLKNWTMRSGDQVYMINTKAEVIRITFSQMVHHRAQLGVFLRLLDIPIPGSYGPSADENGF